MSNIYFIFGIIIELNIFLSIINLRLNLINMISFDIAVIGGGVVGGMLTRSLSARYPNHKIGLFEKESGLGLHTSTRNSAVLHAGFYYASNTVKASLCKEGNKTLT